MLTKNRENVNLLNENKIDRCFLFWFYKINHIRPTSSFSFSFSLLLFIRCTYIYKKRTKLNIFLDKFYKYK